MKPNGIRVIYVGGHTSIYRLEDDCVAALGKSGWFLTGEAIRLKKVDGLVLHIRSDNVLSIEVVTIQVKPLAKQAINPLEDEVLYDNPLS